MTPTSRHVLRTELRDEEHRISFTTTHYYVSSCELPPSASEYYAKGRIIKPYVSSQSISFIAAKSLDMPPLYLVIRFAGRFAYK